MATEIRFLRGDEAGNEAEAVEANPRDPVRYLLTVHNHGGQDATNVTVTQHVAADVVELAELSGGTFDAATGTVTWQLDDAAGQVERGAVGEAARSRSRRRPACRRSPRRPT